MQQRLVILGAGESGMGAALLGKQKGYDVFVSEKGIITEKNKEVLTHFGVEWEEKSHTESLILNADLVMKSPGIPDHVPLVKQLVAKGISVISEIELGALFTTVPIVGITGSNGKTTTATLTHKLLDDGGLNVGLGGNIGYSFARQIAEKDYANYVLEISSFQLDGIETFRPDIAVITTITPDHLDRYDNDFGKYVASKFRIVMNQKASDYFIYDADNEVITNWIASHPIPSQKMPFSIQEKLEHGAYLDNENIIINTKDNQFTMPLASLQLTGNHNLKNAMAASTVATLLKIRKETIRQSLQQFQGVEHRLEHVLKINHVTYINDSKATNVNATFYALDSMETPTVWIVGGVDKGNDYEELLPLVNEKVKAIICLGYDNSKIINAFGNVVDLMVETQSMHDAVQVAYRLSEKGDTVLLSPACASFDLFENYEDRGRQFKHEIRNL